MQTRDLRVLFLDIDGVLNSRHWFTTRPAWETFEGEYSFWHYNLSPLLVGRLNTIIEHTGAQVVISSNWRRGLSLSDLRAVLQTRGFRGRILGKTGVDTQEERWREISDWLRAQPVPPVAFVVLDDEPLPQEAQRFFVRTDSAVGLSDDDVARAIALLRSASPSEEGLAPGSGATPGVPTIAGEASTQSQVTTPHG